MTRLYAIAAAAVAAVFLGGLWIMTMGGNGSGDKFAQCRSSAVAGGTGQIGGPFTLIDETGQTVTETDVIDGPTLLYFGYAFCPDVCPLDTARNAEAVEILEDRGIKVKPVFISVDPQRDTPELLADFTDNLHPRMLGLTGTPEQVKTASQAYRTYYKVQEPEEGNEDYYLIDHSTFSYLSFPEEGFVEFFKRDLGPEQLADRIQCFVEAQ
jgi:protein SCO1/2